MDLDWTHLSALAAIALFAAIVRGYSGFGFSAIVIAAGALFVEPAVLVPALYMLEIVASIHMLPDVRRHIDYPNLWPMLVSCLIGLPVGQFLLTNLHADTIRICLSFGVLSSTALLWRGLRFERDMTKPLAGLTGFLIGFGSGIASIGGLPAMVIFLGINYPAAKTRAMFVVIFLVMYVYGVGVSFLNDLISWQTVWIGSVMLVSLFAGMILGQKQYLSATQESFRKFALLVLTVLAILGAARVLLI